MRSPSPENTGDGNEIYVGTESIQGRRSLCTSANTYFLMSDKNQVHQFKSDFQKCKNQSGYMQICIFSHHKHSLGVQEISSPILQKQSQKCYKRYRIIFKNFSRNYSTCTHYSELLGVFPSRFCFSYIIKILLIFWGFFFKYQHKHFSALVIFSGNQISHCTEVSKLT